MVAGVELDPLVVVDGCVVDWPDDDADVDDPVDPELDEDAEPEAVLVELAVETDDEVPGCVPAPPCPVFPFVFVADEVLTALEELGRNSADDEATDSVELADEARELRMLEGTAVASDECEELSDAVVAEEELLDAAEDDAP